MESLALLNKFYPGWTLTELKRLARREREWWISMALWRDAKGV